MCVGVEDSSCVEVWRATGRKRKVLQVCGGRERYREQHVCVDVEASRCLEVQRN